MKKPATRLMTSASPVESAILREKNVPSSFCGMRSRIQEFHPQCETAENDEYRTMQEIRAMIPSSGERKNGIRMIGTQKSRPMPDARTTTSRRFRTLSTM